MNKTDREEWSSIVFVRGPEKRVVLVLDPSKPRPHYWEFPEGKRNNNESPRHTAVRELAEETGLSVEIDDLVLLCKKPKKNHTLFVFHVEVEDFERLLTYGIGGERVGSFDEDSFIEIDFLPEHRKILEELEDTTYSNFGQTKIA